jgi:hypothetical protein
MASLLPAIEIRKDERREEKRREEKRREEKIVRECYEVNT